MSCLCMEYLTITCNQRKQIESLREHVSSITVQRDAEMVPAALSSMMYLDGGGLMLCWRRLVQRG